MPQTPHIMAGKYEMQWDTTSGDLLKNRLYFAGRARALYSQDPDSYTVPLAFVPLTDDLINEALSHIDDQTIINKIKNQPRLLYKILDVAIQRATATHVLMQEIDYMEPDELKEALKHK